MNDNYLGYTNSAAFSALDQDWEIALGQEYFRASFLPLLPIAKQSRILEIGCGYGKNLLALREAGYQNIMGIDISPDQVRFAHERFNLTMVEQADCLEWLQGHPALFDCILIIDVLEHLPLADLFKLASLLENHLVPGGRVIVQVPNDLAPLNPSRAGDVTHCRSFTTQSLRQFFLQAGLVDVSFSRPKRVGSVLNRVIRRWFVDVIAEIFLKTLFRMLYGKLSCRLLFSGNIIGYARKRL